MGQINAKHNYGFEMHHDLPKNEKVTFQAHRGISMETIALLETKDCQQGESLLVTKEHHPEISANGQVLLTAKVYPEEGGPIWCSKKCYLEYNVIQSYTASSLLRKCARTREWLEEVEFLRKPHSPKTSRESRAAKPNII